MCSWLCGSRPASASASKNTACLPLEEEPGEAPGGGAGHVSLVADGHGSLLETVTRSIPLTSGRLLCRLLVISQHLFGHSVTVGTNRTNHLKSPFDSCERYYVSLCFGLRPPLAAELYSLRQASCGARPRLTSPLLAAHNRPSKKHYKEGRGKDQEGGTVEAQELNLEVNDKNLLQDFGSKVVWVRCIMRNQKVLSNCFCFLYLIFRCKSYIFPSSCLLSPASIDILTGLKYRTFSTFLLNTQKSNLRLAGGMQSLYCGNLINKKALFDIRQAVFKVRI